MKNKYLAVGVMVSLSLSNIAVAAGLNADRATVLSRAPIYVMVKLGMDGLCAESLPAEAPEGCLLKAQLGENTEWKGSVEAVQGKMTLAKELFIGSDETIKNAEGDLGLPTAKIDFDFKTPFYKGLIIKVQPDADYAEVGLPSDIGRLVFNENIGGKEIKVQEINYSDLVGLKSYAWGSDGYGRGYLIRVIDFDSKADLATRNAIFNNKLTVTSKLQYVENWARAQLISGKINRDLYLDIDGLVDASWFKNYSSEDPLQFQRRYNRLLNNLKNEKVTPALFYGGLNQLMKRLGK